MVEIYITIKPFLIIELKMVIPYFSIKAQSGAGAGFGLCTIDVEKNNTRIIELDYFIKLLLIEA